ncbi:hypothetical protein BMS3Bbin04_00684 [bacterium BMS3Bbin04]|nr:hypothetical protein BMS3Bbin04_00684 [bacterium BMS3Bbin04]
MRNVNRVFPGHTSIQTLEDIQIVVPLGVVSLPEDFTKCSETGHYDARRNLFTGRARSNVCRDVHRQVSDHMRIATWVRNHHTSDRVWSETVVRNLHHVRITHTHLMLGDVDMIRVTEH